MVRYIAINMKLTEDRLRLIYFTKKTISVFFFIKWALYINYFLIPGSEFNLKSILSITNFIVL